MHKIIEDILYIGDVQKGCKCEDKENKYLLQEREEYP
jgi:hypothetical protein